MRLQARLAVCAVLALVSMPPEWSWGRAGQLKVPGIAITEGNATAAAMNQVLADHKQYFSEGHYINAHTVLHFDGGIKAINSLIERLSEIEGAEISIRIKRSEVLESKELIRSEKPEHQCECQINHNAWHNANSITIEIVPGSDLEQLELPTILGRGKNKK